MTQHDIDQIIAALARGGEKAVREATAALEDFQRACANVKLPSIVWKNDSPAKVTYK